MVQDAKQSAACCCIKVASPYFPQSTSLSCSLHQKWHKRALNRYTRPLLDGCEAGETLLEAALLAPGLEGTGVPGSVTDCGQAE
jgi:hypothetical protein